MNSDLLHREMPASEHPGLEITDPRLTDIASLAQNGEYLQAAEASQEVLAEEIVDIRLLGFFLYGLFLEGGVRALGDIFSDAAWFLEHNWAVAGPVEKREKHGQATFRWLFTQMEKKLKFEEGSQGAYWQRWLQESDSEDVARAITEADGLVEVIQETLGQKPDGIEKIKSWLSSFQKLAAQTAIEEEEEETFDNEQEADEEEIEPAPRSSAGAEARTLPSVLAGAPDSSGLWVEGSFHLGELMSKIETFEMLMEKDMFPQAALVADDIMESIENFDPLRYFPKLFSRFFMLFATRSDELLGFDEFKESREWQLFRQYFKVDREGFVNLDTMMGRNDEED